MPHEEEAGEALVLLALHLPEVVRRVVMHLETSEADRIREGA
jgi:hypothetical protein